MSARLLIVDDELEIRELLARHFGMLGYDVSLAADGKEALVVLAQKRIDIVISDIMMPELDGVGLLRAVRHEYPMVRVVIITGYVTLENALACLRNGADTCVFKPFIDFIELDEAVNSAMQMMRRWQQKLRELHDMKPRAMEVRGA